jgi:hypothetical protein
MGVNVGYRCECFVKCFESGGGLSGATECANCSIVLLGAFAKFRKATTVFVMSVGPHATTRLPLDGFS